MSQVICLSSDEEFQPEREQTREKAEKSRAADKPSQNLKAKKRKASKYIGWQPALKKKVESKKIKVVSIESEKKSQDVKSSGKAPSKNTIKPTMEAWNQPSTSKQSMKIEDNASKDAPQLVIREKRPAMNNHLGSEVFAQFLSQCLSRDRSPSMEKIVEKLKRHYDQLDPDYARSSRFIDLLNEKREALLVYDNRLYIHISDVDKEMKCRKRGTAQSAVREASKPIAETEENDGEKIDPKIILKIKKIVLVMEKCEKRIKQLEIADVDWDDDNNSSYIKLGRYKERIIQLHCKYCELAGEYADAGRTYLRPKYLKVTKISSVDQAIVSFINKKLMEKVEKRRKGLSAADCVIFPDYCDVLSCIQRCNNEQNMGMSKAQTEKLAQNAFKELGNYLQHVRQRDFLDTFSLLDEGTEDPAVKNSELAMRLKQSSIEGKKKLDKLFEDFVRKQEEGSSKDEPGDDNDSEENETDEENDNDEINSNDIENLANVSDDELDEIFIKNDPEVDDDLTSLLCNEISDSRETIVITPPLDTKQESQVLCNGAEEFTSRKSIQNQVVLKTEENLVDSNCRVWKIEGTAANGKRLVLSEEEKKVQRIQRAGPRWTKNSLKPTITNIQDVRVVIKPHEIVDFSDKLKAKIALNKRKASEPSGVPRKENEASNSEQLSLSEESIESNVKIKASQSSQILANVTARIEKSPEEIEDVTTMRRGNTNFDTTPEASPPTADNDDSEDVTLRNQEILNDTPMKIQASADSQEGILILDEIMTDAEPISRSSPINRKEGQLQSTASKLCRADSTMKSPKSNTSAPSTPTELQKSFLIKKPIENLSSDEKITNDNGAHEVENDNRAIRNAIVTNESAKIRRRKVSSAAPLLTLADKAPVDIKADDEVLLDEDNEQKPVLKLRSFAKPPEYWISPPPSQLHQSQKKVQSNSSKSIECVDLDGEEASEIDAIPLNRSQGTDRTLTRAGTSSRAKPRPIGLIKVSTVNPTNNRSPNRLIGPVKPMKMTNIVAIKKSGTVIIPYNHNKPKSQTTEQQDLIKKNYATSIKNATTDLSNILKQGPKKSITAISGMNAEKTIRINPVNRIMLTKVAQKVVNPVAKMNLSQKQVSTVKNLSEKNS